MCAKLWHSRRGLLTSLFDYMLCALYMNTIGSNRVRELRESRGLSQVTLADAVQVTRQSIHAIESSRSSPSVDVALRLARILECQVEDLFGVEPTESELSTEPSIVGMAGRVAIAHLADRWVAYPLMREGIGRSADALVKRVHGRKLEVELLRPAAVSQENMVLMGCAPALGLLADRLNARQGAGRFLWFPRSSTESLRSLAQRHTHLAGVHLTDAKTGQDNVPDVRRHTRHHEVALITLGRWEAGLLTASGNPKGVRDAADLRRKGMRVVVREPGAGARRLLDRELNRCGVSIDLDGAAAVHATGHLEVASAIAMGAGDVGVATRDSALVFGLHFIPMAEERYDLVIPAELLTERRMCRLLDLLTTIAFRKELSSIGYDMSSCGERYVEESAA